MNNLKPENPDEYTYYQDAVTKVLYVFVKDEWTLLDHAVEPLVDRIKKLEQRLSELTSLKTELIMRAKEAHNYIKELKTIHTPLLKHECYEFDGLELCEFDIEMVCGSCSDIKGKTLKEKVENFYKLEEDAQLKTRKEALKELSDLGQDMMGDDY